MSLSVKSITRGVAYRFLIPRSSKLAARLKLHEGKVGVSEASLMHRSPAPERPKRFSTGTLPLLTVRAKEALESRYGFPTARLVRQVGWLQSLKDVGVELDGRGYTLPRAFTHGLLTRGIVNAVGVGLLFLAGVEAGYGVGLLAFASLNILGRVFGGAVENDGIAALGFCGEAVSD